MKLLPLALSLMTVASVVSCQSTSPVAPEASVSSQTLQVVKAEPIALAAQRPDLIDLGDTQTPEVFSTAEQAAIEKLIAQAEPKIAEEDAARGMQSKADFAIQSADQGKDVDIEMFLYHPKYGQKAKSWGIDNAYEFLQAGRSPWRRWVLRLKLEGLFAPKDFSRQLLFWVEQADLLRLKDVNKDQAWLLVASGITSVPDLARRSSFELGAMVVSMQITALTYGIDAPSLSELKDWAEEAQTLDPVIY